jgi:hypothetical protein
MEWNAAHTTSGGTQSGVTLQGQVASSLRSDHGSKLRVKGSSSVLDNWGGKGSSALFNWGGSSLRGQAVSMAIAGADLSRGFSRNKGIGSIEALQGHSGGLAGWETAGVWMILAGIVAFGVVVGMRRILLRKKERRKEMCVIEGGYGAVGLVEEAA